MSRCFPYPPPGYCRNGATYEALIESIKLQKETDKAKAERKREKRLKKERKEKKKIEKEKRKNDEKVKSQKDQSQEDPHKLLNAAACTEAQIKGTKTNNELLEKSDLTEEHGQPIKPSYSSDSTQNSNKRRRDDDDVLLPDDSNSHGKPIKIRLLQKHKGSDSSNSGEDARSKTASSNTNNGIPTTSGRENNALQGNPLTQTKLNSSFKQTKNSNPNGLHLGREQSAKPILPSGSRKSDQEVLKTIRQQQQIASFVRPVVSQSQLEHEIPSSSASTNIGVQGLYSGRQQQGPSNLMPGIVDPVFNKPSLTTTGKRPINEGLNSGRQLQGPSNLMPGISDPVLNKPSLATTGESPIKEGLSSGRQQQGPSNLMPGITDPVLNKPSQTTTGKRPINEVTVPGTSGPTKPEKKKDPKKAGHTRLQKKILKKLAKYEKVIGSWVPPPVFQALLHDVDDDDEDWLSKRTKVAKSSISRGEVETCYELAETSLWQPRARFLAEADIHALPYTVPF